VLKLSGLLGLLFVCLGAKLFEFYGTHEIQPFLILQAYIIFTLFSVYKLSDKLQLKAMCLYVGLVWCISFVTDFFLIDFSLLLTMLGALPLYILSAKRVINNKRDIRLSFNKCLVVHLKPFRWYHWVWILVGKDLDAYRAFYDPEQELYVRMEKGKLVVRKVSHDLFAREMRAMGSDVSPATITYEGLRKKLGTKINCKKEIY